MNIFMTPYSYSCFFSAKFRIRAEKMQCFFVRKLSVRTPADRLGAAVRQYWPRQSVPPSCRQITELLYFVLKLLSRLRRFSFLSSSGFYISWVHDFHTGCSRGLLHFYTGTHYLRLLGHTGSVLNNVS